ncbi:hypothetical protein [Micromonospora sp. NPDC000442]|uniref:phosphotransferase-like protein n=1 Tax=Micromonospora sp. NPDC000442 TaxID=3364217 RepID=UPI003692A392
MAGVAATVGAGAHVIVDDVFLGGAGSQQRWRAVLDGLDVLWAGVRCDAEVAAGREIARGDRVRGMAAAQAHLVHRGVVYDVEVDTTHNPHRVDRVCPNDRGSAVKGLTCHDAAAVVHPPSTERGRRQIRTQVTPSRCEA